MGSTFERLLRSSVRIPFRVSRWTLSWRFAVTSFVVFLLLGVSLAVILGQAVQGIALSEARQTAFDDLHTRLVHQIMRRDLVAGRMTPERYAAFDAFVKRDIISDRTIRVKVWTPSGAVLYSDDRKIVGHTFPVAGELADALRGDLASEVSELTKSENRDDRRFGTLLEVYIPIQYRPGGTIYGAFEIYQTYGPVAREVGTLQRSVYSLLAAGLLVLYLLLFGIVHRGSMTIAGQQKRLIKQALYDDLTGLPNRAMFHDRVERAITAAQGAGHPTSLLLMDLDRFKEINDTFGHQYGDILLQEFGAHIIGTLAEGDTIARLGGDEFAVLLSSAGEAEAVSVARDILASLQRPFNLQGQSLQVTASIGIALYPEHGTDASALLQRADVAMYHAKRTESGAAVYAVAHDEYSPDRLALINELRQAIERDHLVLHYQPKLEVKSGRIGGVEALVRWMHPERGLIPPDQFIPLAEHTGLIRPLTTWVLHRAVRQCRDWHAQGLDLSVAVNLSARSLHDPHLVQTIAGVLQSYGVRPDRFEVELTESALMADAARGTEILAQLHAMGVRIAIDDFGTGYSSLAYLRHLPVDEIKIDKSFVRNVSTNEGDLFIVRSVTDLGHSLGLEVVAEGVEDQRALQLLALTGCDLAQGFHLSRPLPANDLQCWMEASLERLAT